MTRTDTIDWHDSHTHTCLTSPIRPCIPACVCVCKCPKKGAASCYHVHMLIIKALFLKIRFRMREVFCFVSKSKSQMGAPPISIWPIYFRRYHGKQSQLERKYTNTNIKYSSFFVLRLVGAFHFECAWEEKVKWERCRSEALYEVIGLPITAPLRLHFKP